ncbi:MAG TPA: CRISPR-associated RAMP protein Csx7 [Thermodesulfovibrionia bacterium]|nr:CRISPR-associated RAMP protein Csx7 [Thermodesulfovibrionia bacterium]
MLELKKKYLFKGKLKLKTALHIGRGKINVTNTDSPVVRTPDGLPFIPGSSFKGSFRSAVEKIAISVPNITSCQLIEESTTCPGVNQKSFTDRKDGMNEKKLIDALEKELCNTCKLFGSPYSASKIIFHDLMMVDWAGVTQIRDGVVIDRDSERAIDKLKYDFEVVPPDSVFNMEIWLDNPSTTELGLTCIGINEFVSGMGYVGGVKSRGLGHCEITNLQVYELDLETENEKFERLKKYLSGSTVEEKMTKTKGSQFISEQIKIFIDTITPN